MEIVRRRGAGCTRDAHGHVVVIDVMRAFTTLACAFDAGARRAVLVATPEQAFSYRERHPEVLLVGEVKGRPIPGFDLGNSPEAIDGMDLSGRTLVFRSSNGVLGATGATAADSIALASLVVADATVAWLRAEQPAVVTLCAMASTSGKDGVEDDACADLIEARLTGSELELDDVVRRVQGSGGGRAARDPDVWHVTPGDLDHAIRVDRFPFAMLAAREGDDLVAVPHPL